MIVQRRLFAVLILLLVFAAAVQGQTSQAPSGESTSRPQPDAVPTPPDAPIPDQGAAPAPESKSRAKRTLNKLDPHCIDIIFHTCWSSPAATAGNPVPDEQKQAAQDIDVGYFYLKDKNYRAAQSRLKEALELQPNNPTALIGLAQAEQKLGDSEAARQHYGAYLKINPNGPDAEKVKNALTQLK